MRKVAADRNDNGIRTLECASDCCHRLPHRNVIRAGRIVLDLGPMYATDRQTSSDVRRASLTTCVRGAQYASAPASWRNLRINSPGGTCSGMMAIEVVQVTRDSDTAFKVKRSKDNLQGAGHIVPASRTPCYYYKHYVAFFRNLGKDLQKATVSLLSKNRKCRLTNLIYIHLYSPSRW